MLIVASHPTEIIRMAATANVASLTLLALDG
jgi:hypothetical protein